MALTHKELRLEVTRNVNPFRSLSRHRITRFLNLAQDQIVEMAQWRELERLAEFTSGFEDDPERDQLINLDSFLPSSDRLDKLVSLHVTTDGQQRRLVFVPALALDRRWDAIPFAGGGEGADLTAVAPTHFALRYHTVQLRPIPNQALNYAIRYRILPTALAAAGDTSDLKEKDELIITMASRSIMMAVSGEEAQELRRDLTIEMNRHVKQAKKQNNRQPGMDIPSSSDRGAGRGEYWKDPFVRSMHPYDSFH